MSIYLSYPKTFMSPDWKNYAQKNQLVQGVFTESDLLNRENKEVIYQDDAKLTAACMLKAVFNEFDFTIGFSNENGSRSDVEILDGSHGLIGLSNSVELKDNETVERIPMNINMLIHEEKEEKEEHNYEIDMSVSEEELQEEEEKIQEEQKEKEVVIVRAVADPTFFFSEDGKKMRSSHIFDGIPKACILGECESKECSKKSNLIDLNNPGKVWCPQHHPEINRRNDFLSNERIKIVTRCLDDHENPIHDIKLIDLPKKEYHPNTKSKVKVTRSWFAFEIMVDDADKLIDEKNFISIAEEWGFPTSALVLWIEKK